MKYHLWPKLRLILPINFLFVVRNLFLKTWAALTMLDVIKNVSFPYRIGQRLNLEYWWVNKTVSTKEIFFSTSWTIVALQLTLSKTWLNLSSDLKVMDVLKVRQMKQTFKETMFDRENAFRWSSIIYAS